MANYEDPDMGNLLEQAKGLFQGGASFNQHHEVEPVASTGYQAPIKGSWFNSGGFTYSPNPTHPKGHPAVDMRALGGTQVYPLGPGIVKGVGSSGLGGNYVKIQHTPELSSYYAHFGTVNVHDGDRVDNNTVLGTVGNTGSASNTFPHLHLEIYKNGTPVDPAGFFSIPKYTDPKNNPEEQPYLKSYWASDDEKQKARSFKMSEHKAQHRQAFSKEINTLMKIATSYYLISKY